MRQKPEDANYSDRIAAGYGQLIQEYIYYLLAKLAFHRQHPEFNGNLTLLLSPKGLANVSRYL